MVKTVLDKTYCFDVFNSIWYTIIRHRTPPVASAHSVAALVWYTSCTRDVHAHNVNTLNTSCNNTQTNYKSTRLQEYNEVGVILRERGFRDDKVSDKNASSVI